MIFLIIHKIYTINNNDSRNWGNHAFDQGHELKKHQKKPAYRSDQHDRSDIKPNIPNHLCKMRVSMGVY